MATLREEDYLHHFLIGLDGAYASVRSNLLAQDPLPNLARAYQQVTQEERLRGSEFSSTKDERDNIMTFKVQADLHGKGKFDNFDKFCRHCNRDGHDESTCFHIHGYPKWWGDRPRGGRGPGRGSLGKGGGRSAGRGRGTTPPVRAHKTGGRGNTGVQTTQAHPDSSETAGLAGVSPSQWQQLLELLNLSRTKDRLQGKYSWIIDTGASNHVTGDRSCMIDVRTIANCPVGLPDGKNADANQEV